ncbi:MAG TPA: hypothetical protein VFT48_18030 [Pyrinomonadaceae bacterium]|nr:hypothetical protein [Pyrinomonadaceae bacterium]
MLTRDSVVIAIHLGARTILKEELCFSAGCHLGATLATVALILGGRLLDCLTLCLFILGITIGAECDDDQSSDYQRSH